MHTILEIEIIKKERKTKASNSLETTILPNSMLLLFSILCSIQYECIPINAITCAVCVCVICIIHDLIWRSHDSLRIASIKLCVFFFLHIRLVVRRTYTIRGHCLAILFIIHFFFFCVHTNKWIQSVCVEEGDCLQFGPNNNKNKKTIQNNMKKKKTIPMNSNCELNYNFQSRDFAIEKGSKTIFLVYGWIKL